MHVGQYHLLTLDRRGEVPGGVLKGGGVRSQDAVNISTAAAITILIMKTSVPTSTTGSARPKPHVGPHDLA